MAFSIKIIDLGAGSGNPSTTFSPAELGQIQLAANDWASLLSNNDFADLSGVSFQVTDGQGSPRPVTLGSDDVTIFVSKGGVVEVPNPTPPPLLIPSTTVIAGAFPGNPITNQLNVDYDYLRAGRGGIKYQRPVGSITFTSNQSFSIYPNTPQASEYDLYTVAKHEIAHILGFTNEARFLAIPSTTFNKRVVSGAFVGPNAGTVPLDQPTAASPNPNHFAASTNNANTTWVTQTRPSNPNSPIDALMVPAYNPGPSILNLAITKLDLAVLADLGYRVDGQGFTNLDLANPAATNNVTSGFMVAGTPSGDTIAGDVGNDTLAGGPGNDSINGGVGIDYMYGGMAVIR
jgi:hypothetical protein